MFCLMYLQLVRCLGKAPSVHNFLCVILRPYSIIINFKNIDPIIKSKNSILMRFQSICILVSSYYLGIAYWYLRSWDQTCIDSTVRYSDFWDISKVGNIPESPPLFAGLFLLSHLH